MTYISLKNVLTQVFSEEGVLFHITMEDALQNKRKIKENKVNFSSKTTIYLIPTNKFIELVISY